VHDLKRKRKASFTVEASILVPVLLFTMALAMKIGLFLYGEMKEQQESQQVESLWEVEDFYINEQIKGVLDDE
jgi:hypothetical protein